MAIIQDAKYSSSILFPTHIYTEVTFKQSNCLTKDWNIVKGITSRLSKQAVKQSQNSFELHFLIRKETPKDGYAQSMENMLNFVLYLTFDIYTTCQLTGITRTNCTYSFHVQEYGFTFAM